MIVSRFARALALLAFAVGATFPVAAFKFFPISMDFAATGTGAVASFQAVNDTAQTIALKLTVFGRSMDEAGNDLLTEAPADFQIYPARLVLKPEQQQRIRVQYRGPTAAGLERAYRIVVEQVPVDFADQDKSAGLKILFRYVGALYVLPDKPEHQVVVAGLERLEQPQGSQLKITLRNTGSAHVILNNLKLQLSSASGPLVLEPAALGDLNGCNILAGASRSLLLPWPKGLEVAGLSGTASFDPAR